MFPSSSKVRAQAGSTGEQLGKDEGVKRGSEDLLEQTGSPIKPNADQFYLAQITDPAMPLRGFIF